MTTTLPTLTATVSPTARTVAAPQSEPPADLLERGALVGRYVILDRVGAGGMGRVYTAYDPELSRKVALKLLHDAAPDELRQARLRREAQVMARLSHPNICAVYDVGSFEGRVFFAMEFVDGATLRAWLGQRVRSWREILAVFLAIGRGLAAAHAEGLVHSDLKPENVMLGADGRPRVMDFGIARTDEVSRAGASSSSSAPLATESERAETPTIRGTPQYMAPEQWSDRSIDARADQFAFCVMLWEALYRRRPFPDGHVAAQVVAGQSLRTPAPAQPSRAPTWLRNLLLRGLSTRPDDRFRTMDALLVALASGQARRRRSLLAAGVAALALVVGGGLGMRSWERRRHVAACEATGASIVDDVWNAAARERVTASVAAAGTSDADELAARVAELHDTFAGRWQGVRADACLVGDVRPLACLYDQRQRFVGLLAALTEDDARARSRAVRVAASLPDPRSCADPVLTPPASLAGDLHDDLLAASLRQDLRRAEVLGATGHMPEARRVGLEVLGRAAAAGLPAVHLEATNVAGMFADWNADYAEAERLLRRAIVEAGALKRDDVAADAAIRLVLVVGSRLARHAEALLIADFAEMLVRRLDQLDRFRGARLLGYRSVILAETGALSEALAANERTIELLRAEFGDLHPEFNQSMNHLAGILMQLGRYRESLARFDEALASAEKLYGENSVEAASTLSNMGLVRDNLGEHASALPLHERALAIFERLHPPDSPDLALVRNNYANGLAALGRHAEARPQFERALQVLEATLGQGHPNVGNVLQGLAVTQLALGERAAAERNSRRALAVWEKTLGPDHPQIVGALNMLGELDRQAGRLDAAIATLERSVAVAQGSPPELVAAARASLARAVWVARRDRPADRALAEQAAAAFRQLGERRAAELADIEAFARELAAP